MKQSTGVGLTQQPMPVFKDNNVIRFRKNFPQHGVEEMKKMLNVHPCEVAFKCLSVDRSCPLKEGFAYWGACNMYKEWLLG